jgi:hypothetical protein
MVFGKTTVIGKPGRVLEEVTQTVWLSIDWFIQTEPFLPDQRQGSRSEDRLRETPPRHWGRLPGAMLHSAK